MPLNLVLQNKEYYNLTCLAVAQCRNREGGYKKPGRIKVPLSKGITLSLSTGALTTSEKVRRMWRLSLDPSGPASIGGWLEKGDVCSAHF